MFSTHATLFGAPLVWDFGPCHDCVCGFVIFCSPLVSNVASGSCSWWTAVQFDVVICSYSSSTSGFGLRCFSAHYGCNQRLIDLWFRTWTSQEKILNQTHLSLTITPRFKSLESLGYFPPSSDIRCEHYLRLLTCVHATFTYRVAALTPSAGIHLTLCMRSVSARQAGGFCLSEDACVTPLSGLSINLERKTHSAF